MVLHVFVISRRRIFSLIMQVCSLRATVSGAELFVIASEKITLMTTLKIS